MSIEDIQIFILDQASSSKDVSFRSLASALITFFLELDYRLFQLMLRNEPGANELFFVHLFKGCLLFESLLKNNPTMEMPKLDNLEQLLSKLKDKFNLPDKIKIGGVSLPNVIKQSHSIDDNLSSFILMTGKYRNTLGHNLGWDIPITYEQYLNAFLTISISCLHAISVLYRK